MGTKDPNVARWYAIAKHGDQKYGQHPYWHHLDGAVVELYHHVLDLPVLRYYDHDTIVCATYLHDVLEDTKTTVEEMDKLFDERITSLVRAVTDGPGKNRKEKKAHVYQAIQNIGPAALAVKLADRLTNAKAAGLSKDPNSSMLLMYRKEQQGFEAALRPFAGDVRHPLDGFGPAFAKIREYLGL